MLSFVVWVPILVYMLLLSLAIVSVLMTALGITIVSVIATVTGIYIIKLYHHHFTPRIWLWKINRWWWIKRNNY